MLHKTLYKTVFELTDEEIDNAIKDLELCECPIVFYSGNYKKLLSEKTIFKKLYLINNGAVFDKNGKIIVYDSEEDSDLDFDYWGFFDEIYEDWEYEMDLLLNGIFNEPCNDNKLKKIVIER